MKEIVFNMENKKIKRIIIMLISILFCIVAFIYVNKMRNDNKQTNYEYKLEYEYEDASNNICYVRGKLTENMEIDANIPSINNKTLMTYRVSGKNSI